MEKRRVFIVGGLLFAETLAQVLAGAENVELAGSAPTAEAALPLLKSGSLDALILACENQPVTTAVGQLLLSDPGLPLILADLEDGQVQVITSRRIGTHVSDLFAAIAALPRRDASS